MIHRKIDNIEAEIFTATHIAGTLANYVEIIKPALIDQRLLQKLAGVYSWQQSL